MNELQKKLARRRCLNGEDGTNNIDSSSSTSMVGAAENSAEPSHEMPKFENRKSVNFSKSDLSFVSTSPKAADELKKKLAYRRSANGESIESFNARSSHQDLPALGRAKSADSSDHTAQSMSNVSMLKLLRAATDTVQANSTENHQRSESSSKSLLPEEKKIEELLPTLKNMEETHNTSTHEPSVVYNATSSIEINVEYAESAAEDSSFLPADPKTESLISDPTKEIFKSAEEMMNMIDHELDSLLQSHHPNHNLLQQSFHRTKKPSADLFEDETILFETGPELVSEIPLPSVSALPHPPLPEAAANIQVKNRATVQIEHSYGDTADKDASPRTLQAPSSQSRDSVTVQSVAVESVSSQVPPTLPISPPLSPKSSSVKSTTVASTPKSKDSNIAFSAAAPTTPNSTSSAIAEKWYPGKYLLGGRWGGTKHKIDMNNEQAQSLYNDLIASGDKVPVSKSRQSSVTGVSVVSAAAAALSASSTTASSSLAPNGTESLLAENHRLKQEIVRLKRLLEEKQAVIDAYELSESLRTGSLGNVKKSNSNSSAVSQQHRFSSGRVPGRDILLQDASPDDDQDDQFPEDDNSADSGFESGNELLFGRGHSHQARHHRVVTGSRANAANFESLLDSNSNETSNLNNVSTGSMGDDGLNALMRTDGDKIVQFNPRTLGNEADLVRSYNYSTSVRITNEQIEDIVDAGDESDDKEEAVALPYENFVQLFSKSAELQFFAKAFILSVLGPNGDATPPVRMVKLDYIFYGTHKLDERCRQFFNDIDVRLKQDAYFSGLSDEQLICAHDGIEQYVMHRIGQHAYKLTEAVDDDILLMRRMNLLSTFLTPEHLEIPTHYFQEDMLVQAGRELKAINKFRTPGDKVACIVRCVTTIFRSLSVARKQQEEALYLQQQQESQQNKLSKTAGYAQNNESENQKEEEEEEEEEKPKLALAGADDFLPLFIWVVLQSKIPRLVSNAEYIQMYLNPKRLMGKSGYCLINLRSAIDFVTYVEASSLKIDPDYFAAKLAAAESYRQRDD